MVTERGFAELLRRLAVLLEIYLLSMLTVIVIFFLDDLKSKFFNFPFRKWPQPVLVQ